jgi:hypothetical protein
MVVTSFVHVTGIVLDDSAWRSSYQEYQPPISNLEVELLLCSWMMNVLDARARLLDEPYLGHHPPASVTFAKSKGQLIHKMSEQFRKDSAKLMIDGSTIRSTIRMLFDRRLLRTERLIMVSYSKKFNQEMKKIMAKATSEQDLRWLSSIYSGTA